MNMRLEVAEREDGQDSFQCLADRMRSGAPLARGFEAGLAELVPSARAEEGIVFRLDPDSQQVSIVARVGELRLNRDAVIGLGESPVKDVIRERTPVFETFVSRQAQRRFGKLLALLRKPDGHEGVQLDDDSLRRLVTWMDTYAHRIGHFSDQQEGALRQLRQSLTSILEE